MKLYWNTSTRILGLTPTAQTSIARIQVKRYETCKIEVVRVNAAGVAELFGPAAAGLVVVKTPGEYTGAAKLLDAAWDAPTEEGSGYLFAFLVGGEALDTAIGTATKVALALEIVADDDGDRFVSPTVELEVFNNYWRENDPPPAGPEDLYPLPGNLLLKTEQALTTEQKTQVQTNLGIVGMLCREAVAGPVTFDTVGAIGQFWFDADTARLWVYVGAQFRYLTLISEA